MIYRQERFPLRGTVFWQRSVLPWRFIQAMQGVNISMSGVLANFKPTPLLEEHLHCQVELQISIGLYSVVVPARFARRHDDGHVAFCFSGATSTGSIDGIIGQARAMM